jgi:hypothetical protein
MWRPNLLDPDQSLTELYDSELTNAVWELLSSSREELTELNARRGTVNTWFGEFTAHDEPQ